MAKKGASAVKAKKQPSTVRRRQPTKKQAKALAKTEAKELARPLGSFRLCAQVFKIMGRYWKTLGGIIIIYLILNVIFASGVSNINSTVNTIKGDLNNISGQSHPLVSASTGFLVLVTSGGSSSSAAGAALQVMLVIIISLVVIWTLRQLLAGKIVKIKQAFYNATNQLIPFLLVLLVIFIQLLPVTFGFSVLAAVAVAVGNISALGTLVMTVLMIVLAGWSFYMLSSSLFALYIVTLPGMQPRAALRSAKNLVRYRRFLVLRRVTFMPLAMLAIAAAIIIPLILYVTFLVTPVFFIMSGLALLFAHTYLYSLYRGLLG